MRKKSYFSVGATNGLLQAIKFDSWRCFGKKTAENAIITICNNVGLKVPAFKYLIEKSNRRTVIRIFDKKYLLIEITKPKE